MKRYCLLTTLLALSTIFWGCDKEEPVAQGNVTVKMSSDVNTGATNGRFFSTVELTDFKINVKEIEFEYDNDDSALADSTIEDVKLKGPFLIDLLKDTNTLTEILATVNLPSTAFDEVEFKFHKTDQPVSGTIDKRWSFYLAGSVEGKSFVIWHDTDEEFEVEFEDGQFYVNSQGVDVIVRFHLGHLMTLITDQLSKARDLNEDGVIEIGPDDIDGNAALAHDIKDLIEDITDAIDDDKD